MVYLFCNQQYGRQFIRTSIDYSKKKDMDLTLVFSDKLPLPKSLVKRHIYKYLHLSRRFIKEKKLSFHYRIPVKLAGNVNSEHFRKKIPCGSHGIIAGFNQIFKKKTIEKFETFVNFHPSILPLYRGPTPSYWCIENNESTTGFTLHEVTEKIDNGLIYSQKIVEIESDCNEASLDQKIALTACPILENYLEFIQHGKSFDRDLVDAFDVYNCHLSYASFSE